jgi:hypothetical protein
MRVALVARFGVDEGLVGRLLFLLIASCGGQSAESAQPIADAAVRPSATDDAAADHEDAASIVWPEASCSRQCPQALPMADSGCGDATFECEYGTDRSSACNLSAWCVSGSWQMGTAGPAGGIPCPTPDAGLGAGCPVAYATSKGRSCASNRLTCDYPEGRCVCTNGVWWCDDPGSLCPKPRPRVGTACPHETQICDYGFCGGYGAERIGCRCGAWELAPLTCGP